MLRFPNPGSSINNFVRIYTEVFNRLGGQVSTLDQIINVIVTANLATSSGYIGDEAIARSTRKDRSRDPLYNQAKMYAECFRWLGWLHSTEYSALNYTCTLLGEQVVRADGDFVPLLDECVLGIVCPNPIINVKGSYNLRPFAFILRVMEVCGGYLSRDEIIFGPLSSSSDRTKHDFSSVVRRIIASRENKKAAENSVNAVACSRGISAVTLENYTRWPIALLRDLGWAVKGTANFRNGVAYPAWYLTDKARAILGRLKDSVDLRVEEMELLELEERQVLAFYSHFRMMAQAGFDTSKFENEIASAERQVKDLFKKLAVSDGNVLFSPFQSLLPQDLQAVFPSSVRAARVEKGLKQVVEVTSLAGRDSRSHLFVHPIMLPSESVGKGGPGTLRLELAELLKAHSTLEEAADAFVDSHARDTKTEFYPLVSHLFQILGFDSENSRPGVNYQRWDAYVRVDNYYLPVEIKSPTEEVALSTKAIRQALENKVIQLSRAGLETQRELSSLVVGYRIPNERGEMSNLIDDVFNAFGLRIGVIDLTSLTRLALCVVKYGKTIEPSQLSKLLGYLDV